MVANDAGTKINQNWEELPNRFTNIQLDLFVIMPNHIHGIIINVGAGLVPAQKRLMLRKMANGFTNGDCAQNGAQKTDIAYLSQGQPQGIAPTVRLKILWVDLTRYMIV